MKTHTIIMMLTLLLVGLVIGCSSSPTSTPSTILNHENINVRYVEPISESEARKLAEFVFEYLGGADSGGGSFHLSLGQRQEIYEIRAESREGLQLDTLRPWAVGFACAVEDIVFVDRKVDIIFIEIEATSEEDWLRSKIVVREMCR